jgi:hypothetical protein
MYYQSKYGYGPLQKLNQRSIDQFVRSMASSSS